MMIFVALASPGLMRDTRSSITRITFDKLIRPDHGDLHIWTDTGHISDLTELRANPHNNFAQLLGEFAWPLANADRSRSKP